MPYTHFSEYLQKKGKKDAFKFAGNFITVMAVLCAALTVLGIVFAPQLTAFFADGYDQETARLCAELTRIMMPTIFFTGIAFSFVGVLQSMDEFNVPAAISLVSNLAVILYYLTLNGRYGIYGLAVAFLVAWLMQALVQMPSLKKKGFRFRPLCHCARRNEQSVQAHAAGHDQHLGAPNKSDYKL